MKRKLFSLLAAAAVLLTGCGGGDPDAPETTTASTKTKTVYVHSSITRVDANSTSRSEYTYRDNNTLSAVAVYDGDDKELQRYRVNCDENGNPVDWITETEEGTDRVSYTYDDLGNTLGTYIYSDDQLMTSTEYTWSGKLRISTTVKAQGFEQRTEYTYNEKGHLIRQDLYVDGELTAYAICTSDEQGRMILSQGYDLEGNPDSTVTCTYEGNTEIRITADAAGITQRTQTIEYDDHGNMIKNTLTDADGKVALTEEHTWKAVEVPENSPRAYV